MAEVHWRKRLKYDFGMAGVLVDDPFAITGRALRRGDNGWQVHVLQRTLRQAGVFLRESGTFDAATEEAVRSAQRDYGMPVDGVVDARFMREIPRHVAYLEAEYEKAVIRKYVPTWNGYHSGTKWPRRAAEFAGVSLACKQMIRDHEVGGKEKKTSYLYHPDGNSGVTIGVGYDFASVHRTPESIKADLISIGIDERSAAIAAGATGLRGNPAEKFVNLYGEKGSKGPLIHLTDEKQNLLLERDLRTFERNIRSGVHVLLLQCEFDALVSFAMNPAKALPHVISSMNQGRIGEALSTMWHAIGKDPQYYNGLQIRRRHEVEFFLIGWFRQ